MLTINHILNRGVEKRRIFLDKMDYHRFVDNLYDFNNKYNVSFSYQNRRKYLQNLPVTIMDRKREPLVEILCWSLMPNHYHFLTVNIVEKGASLFSKKITGGYTIYFNLKNERNGVLFQGKTKIISVVKNSHYLYLPFYILSNPLKLLQPNWKEKGVDNPQKALNFLKDYQWSSASDLLGKNSFPNIINKGLFYELFDTDKKKFEDDFLGWLKSYSDVRPPKKYVFS